MLAESVILITLFAYFTAVVSTYAELMHGPKDEEEEEKPEDDKEGDKWNKWSNQLEDLTFIVWSKVMNSESLVKKQ